METPKLTDSALNALRPAAPLLPLDTDTEDNATVCPPSLPNCGPEPGVDRPAPVSPERAASATL